VVEAVLHVGLRQWVLLTVSDDLLRGVYSDFNPGTLVWSDLLDGHGVVGDEGLRTDGVGMVMRLRLVLYLLRSLLDDVRREMIDD
jgi:hypothetical protein